MQLSSLHQRNAQTSQNEQKHSVILSIANQSLNLYQCILVRLGVRFLLGFSHTDVLEGHRDESSAEVVVEEALEDVQGHVGQAGVNVGVHGQHHRIGPRHTTRHYITLGVTHQKNDIYHHGHTSRHNYTVEL